MRCSRRSPACAGGAGVAAPTASAAPGTNTLVGAEAAKVGARTRAGAAEAETKGKADTTDTTDTTDTADTADNPCTMGEGSLVDTTGRAVAADVAVAAR